MKTLEVAQLRRVLRREKKALIELCETEWQAGRVNLSNGVTAGLARVQLLEALIDGSAVKLASEEAESATRPDDSLDL